MRKLVVCGVTALVFATAAGVALAQSEATSLIVKQTARAEGTSSGLRFKVTFADAEAPNGLPSGLKRFKIKLHKGTKFDGRGATQCKVSDAVLDAKGLAACPKSSRVGSGTASATSAAGVTVKPESVIFNEVVNGRDALLFLFVIDDAVVAGFDAYIKGRTMTATGLTGALPGELVVTEFAGTIGRHSKGRGQQRRNLITTPEVCPQGSRSWKNTANFVFVNGDKDSGFSTSPCKPGD
jgi:hypothetical protein